MTIARTWISSVFFACVLVPSALADEIPGMASWRWDWKGAATSDWPPYNGIVSGGNTAASVALLRVPALDENWTWTAYSGNSSSARTSSGNAPSSTWYTTALPTAASGVVPPSFTYISAPKITPTPTATPTATTSSATAQPTFQISPISPSSSGSTNPTSADAFVNFGSGPYPGENGLTTGNAQPWSQSPVVSRVFGGTPNAGQQQSFINDVVARVEQIYHNQGIPLTLTTDPTVSASRTESVVSGTSYSGNPAAIGIASMGSSGFSFIDKFDPVTSVDELEKALSYNIAHELMHTFGVDHLDKTGNYLDAATASWDKLTKDGLLFSPQAVEALKNRNMNGTTSASIGAELAHSGAHDCSGDCPHSYPSAQVCPYCEMGTVPGPRSETIIPSPVPEPGTLLVWAALIGAGATGKALRSRRRAA